MEYRKAVFIDKDGTLIPNIPYNVDPEKIILSTKASDGLIKLQNSGFLLVIVTNQSGVAKGLFKEKDLEKVRKKIETLFVADNIQLSGFYFCPHHPHGIINQYSMTCNCRKPSEGLLVNAAKDLTIDLTKSWMIGDILNDVEAGNRAGCRSILLNNGNETEWKNGDYRKPAYIASNIAEAADYILNTSNYGTYTSKDLLVAH